MQKLRVIILEDDPLSSRCLELILDRSSELKVVGVARNGQNVLSLLEKHQPDIAILDYHLHNEVGPSGYNLVREVKRIAPATKIVTLTGVSNPYTLSLAHTNGADSIILKGSLTSYKELVDMICRTHKGECFFPKKNDLDIKIYKARAEQARFENSFSNTQREAIKLLSEYRSVPEIAQSLRIVSGSIRTALSVARRKQNFRDNRGLIELYRRLYPDSERSLDA